MRKNEKQVEKADILAFGARNGPVDAPGDGTCGDRHSPQWPGFRGNDANMEVTASNPAKNSVKLNRAKKLGTRWRAVPSAQIIIDDFMTNEKSIYKLNMMDGASLS